MLTKIAKIAENRIAIGFCCMCNLETVKFCYKLIFDIVLTFHGIVFIHRFFLLLSTQQHLYLCRMYIIINVFVFHSNEITNVTEKSLCYLKICLYGFMFLFCVFSCLFFVVFIAKAFHVSMKYTRNHLVYSKSKQKMLYIHNEFVE